VYECEGVYDGVEWYVLPPPLLAFHEPPPIRPPVPPPAIATLDTSANTRTASHFTPAS
jgi:hypothetical protein